MGSTPVKFADGCHTGITGITRTASGESTHDFCVNAPALAPLLAAPPRFAREGWPLPISIAFRPWRLPSPPNTNEKKDIP